MYLSKLVVRNFRSIEKLEVELGPGLNVLLGENNVGKTSLLDALRAALGAAAATGDAIRLTKDDLRLGSDGRAVTDPISVDVFFSGLTLEEQGEFIDALNYEPEEPEKSTASIHFEWFYSESTKRYHSKRWGGLKKTAETPVPDDVLQGLPITLLGALRDAVTALAPGRQSRLGRLLQTSASASDQEEVVKIALEANEGLEKTDLIKSAAERIRAALVGASGPTFAQEAQILTSEPDFERIVNSLQLVLRLPGLVTPEGTLATQGLKNNGLGFNNLLYIGTVMAELQATAKAQASLPILLVEEPEAHLHPQLQTLLASFLADPRPEDEAQRLVQTIVTTHSPTVASHVPTDTIRVVHRTPAKDLRCVALRECGLTERETGQLRRMLDVTRATMLFSRGVIFVEGIAEALLLPILARRIGVSLEQEGISVVQVAGVDFKTLAKLFGPGKLELPVAIITDGDPGYYRQYPMPKDTPSWAHTIPARDQSGALAPCARTQGLMEDFEGIHNVKVVHSEVTLEYDLAAAGEHNPAVMCRAWEACFTGAPETFNRNKLEEAADRYQQVLAVWRGICVASPSIGKGAFAQSLAAEITPIKLFATEEEKALFTVPGYIQEAVHFVAGRVQPPDGAAVGSVATTSVVADAGRYEVQIR